MEPHPYRYVATVVRVVDGDTVDLRVTLNKHVDHGFRIYRHTSAGEVEVRFRLKGINAPERGQPGGQEATAFLGWRLPPGRPVLIESDKDPRGGFGRWAATIWFTEAGYASESVNEAMVKHGHAQPSVRG